MLVSDSEALKPHHVFRTHLYVQLFLFYGINQSGAQQTALKVMDHCPPSLALKDRVLEECCAFFPHEELHTAGGMEVRGQAGYIEMLYFCLREGRPDDGPGSLE